jgi:hypothetical protein
LAGRLGDPARCGEPDPVCGSASPVCFRMPASYSVALVAIIIADVRPLRAVRGPYLAPAPIPVRRIAGDKRSTKKRKVAARPGHCRI